MTDRIARSVAFTIDVDEALDRLAHSEGTSRADLVRQALTLLFRSRGIDLDATDGIALDRVAVTHQRNRRHAPPGDRVRAAWSDWCAEHRDAVVDRGHDPATVDAVLEYVTSAIDRDGRVTESVAAAVVPGGYKANYRACVAVEAIVIDLVGIGALRFVSRRGGHRWLQPAPWAMPDAVADKGPNRGPTASGLGADLQQKR